MEGRRIHDLYTSPVSLFTTQKTITTRRYPRLSSHRSRIMINKAEVEQACMHSNHEIQETISIIQRCANPTTQNTPLPPFPADPASLARHPLSLIGPAGVPEYYPSSSSKKLNLFKWQMVVAIAFRGGGIVCRIADLVLGGRREVVQRAWADSGGLLWWHFRDAACWKREYYSIC